IWPHMSVFDNVAYPLQVRGMGRREIADKVAGVLRFVQLEGVERRSATRLSGGQQQRVALARALAAEPKVILFDEPLSNLDAKLREETRKELKTFLGKLKITAVYVTHDRVEALALSDDIAVMRAGRIVEIGTPQQIYFHAQHRFVADFIGRANLIGATVRGHDDATTFVDTPLGPIACERRDLAVGSEATLCIRPEFMRVAAGARAGDDNVNGGKVGDGSIGDGSVGGGNVIRGVVESLAFVGEVYEAEVRTGGLLLLARIDPGVDIHEGDAVSLCVDPAHCLLVSR
ncbi:MAG TPA: ABC transporter ATP-binding protein, partial [Caldimonas sp.]|nr:ABC transporter ATP-binding protein [Caldimonas sp.]